MSALRHPYIAGRKSRQSPPYYRGIAIAALALSLGGCAGLGLPFGGELSTASSVTPMKASLVSASVTDAVDPSDWETVRRTVAATASGAGIGRIEWTNPDTGSSGTIAALAAATDRSGMLCRSFATTVNDMRGIRRYRGDACQRTDGRWQLHGMIPDDARLS